MKLHSILHGTRANGPGKRTTVWFQGCGLKCPGCWNPLTHAFDVGEEITPEELARRVVREAPANTEGVTISGGEPMHQAVSLYAFISMIRALRPDWSVGMFTGYTITELKAGEFDLREPLSGPKHALWLHSICPALDFVIAGRFDATRTSPTDRADLPYRASVSSANQAIFLGSRYTFASFPPLMVEVQIDPQGNGFITGFPMKGKRT